jgi:hypothetical protein
MKKLLSGLIAAFLLSAGFVAISAETAQASCPRSQYTPCPASSAGKSSAPKTVKVGKKAKVVVRITTAGNVKPRGSASVTFKGPGVNKTSKVSYNGKPVTVTSPVLKKKGTVKVTISFKGTNVRDSKKTLTIKVKK